MVWDADAPNGGFSNANRTWLPVKEPQRARAVSAQGENSVLTHYREMLTLRKGTEALRAGKQGFLDMPEPILAYTRRR